MRLRLKQPVVLLAVLCVGATSSNVACGQSAVWGLRVGDRFSVETTIDRETVVQLADRAEITSTSQEVLELEYQVWKVTAVETMMQVRVVRFVRSDNSGNAVTGSLSDERLKLLERVPITITIDPGGVLTNVTGYREALQQFAGPDRNMLQLLQEAFPPESFASWIGRPFWMTQPDNADEDNTTWERIDQLSLGLMGGLRTVATCRIDTQENNSADVSITGAVRLIAPLPLKSGASPRSVSFRDVKATAETFSGEGRMLLPEQTTEDDPTPAKRRPSFASLVLDWSVSGEAMVDSGDRSQKVVFQHRQKQSSQLQPNYRMGPPSGFDIPSQPAP